LSNEI
jgi:flagellar biosynthesis/type III secretory pathway M-ring protein FliF/YscJ